MRARQRAVGDDPYIGVADAQHAVGPSTSVQLREWLSVTMLMPPAREKSKRSSSTQCMLRPLAHESIGLFRLIAPRPPFASLSTGSGTGEDRAG